jgi:hypothetical protein
MIPGFPIWQDVKGLFREHIFVLIESILDVARCVLDMSLCKSLRSSGCGADEFLMRPEMSQEHPITFLDLGVVGEIIRRVAAKNVIRVDTIILFFQLNHSWDRSSATPSLPFVLLTEVTDITPSLVSTLPTL